MTTWTTMIANEGRDWDSIDEYAAAVDAVEQVKARAESAFAAALASGLVLVEHWLIGVAPSVTVWTNREQWNDKTHTTAAHVANRFRAGWTRVELMPESEAVAKGYELRN